jgi:hypothetical protein
VSITNEEMGKSTEQSFFKGSSTNGKKHMKKCSTSLAIKEMQTTTTLRFHLTPVRMTTIKNSKNNKCWQGCSEKRYSMEGPHKTKNRAAI